MKKIRATLTIELPYSNELMNYGQELDKAIRNVIDNTEFLNCKIVAGESFNDHSVPILTLNKSWSTPHNMRGMYIPEQDNNET